MCNTLAHRGPDDEGFFVDGGVGLGMRRLSVIDLATGHQPKHRDEMDEDKYEYRLTLRPTEYRRQLVILEFGQNYGRILVAGYQPKHRDEIDEDR